MNFKTSKHPIKPTLKPIKTLVMYFQYMVPPLATFEWARAVQRMRGSWAVFGRFHMAFGRVGRSRSTGEWASLLPLLKPY